MGAKALAKSMFSAERRLKALSFKKQGGSYREVMKNMLLIKNPAEGAEGHWPHIEVGAQLYPGYTQTQAWRDVGTELNTLAKKSGETATQIRTLNLVRLEDSLAGVYQAARAGDPLAIDRLIKIMQQQDRYTGAAMPEKVEHTGKGGGPIETKTEHVVLYLPDNNRDSKEPQSG